MHFYTLSCFSDIITYPSAGPAAWLYTLCFVNCSNFTVAFLFISCHSHLQPLPLVETSFPLWTKTVMFACNTSCVIRTVWLILPANVKNIFCVSLTEA